MIIYVNSFFFFILVPIVVNEKIDLTKIFNYSSLLVVPITLGIYGVLVFDLSLFDDLYQYLVLDKGVVMYAMRKLGDFTLLMIFYNTSPLLVFPLAYYLDHVFVKQNSKKLILNLIIIISIILTLFLSGTRANLLSLVLIIVFYFSYFIYLKSRRLFIILSGFYGLFAIYGLAKIGGVLFNAQELSNTIKFGHFVSYIELFSDNIGSYIFGQGVGSSFYSSGIHSMTNVTELSYLELIRIWGLPITILFVSILFIPIFHQIKSKKISPLFIAYLAYLFIAGTNPLLLSSTGMVVLVYVFSETFMNIKNPKEQNTEFQIDNNLA